jgi:hypothetical protein
MHIGYFWFKTGIPNIVCVQSTICDIITKTKYHFRYLLKPHGARREIYKTTGVSIGKKELWFLILSLFLLKKIKIKILGVAQPPLWATWGWPATPIFGASQTTLGGSTTPKGQNLICVFFLTLALGGG